MNDLDLGAYCRAVETHLCRVNGGHLVRVVGVAFELVKRWHAEGVPLKIVMRGIDGRAERAARAGAPGRRPLRLEFCEADVLDLLDQWRRAVGFALHVPPAGPGERLPEAAGPDGHEPEARRVSLPRHLERVAVKLTSFLSSTGEAPALRARVESMLAEVDALRRETRGARGETREAALSRLAALDAQLLAALPAEAPAGVMASARQEARDDLAAYSGRMAADAFADLVENATCRIARDRLGLPEFGVR